MSTDKGNYNSRIDTAPKSPSLHVKQHMGLESVPTSELQNDEGQEKGNISAREVNSSRKNYHKNSGSLLSLDNQADQRRPPSAQNRSRSKLEF